MMRTVFSALLVAATVLFGAQGAFAASPRDAALERSALIGQMERDGVLTAQAAAAAVEKYVDKDALKAEEPKPADALKTEESNWKGLLSWVNFVKAVAVVLFLVAFWGIITKVVKGLWGFITAVPVDIWQSGFLFATLALTFGGPRLWGAQAFYAALFGSLANLMLFGWIMGTHERLAKFIKNLFHIGLPVESVASFWACLYFAAFALSWKSQIFGFLSAVAFSGVFSFGMRYGFGTLWLSTKWEWTSAVLIGNLAACAAYVAAKWFGVFPEQVALFAAGVEWYCALALGVALLIGASPWSGKGNKGLYALTAIALSVASSYLYFFMGIEALAVMVWAFSILVALEWLAHVGYTGGLIFGSAVMGGSLYGLAMLFERFAPMITLRLG